MLSTRLTILAAVAVAASLTLAACGGGDDDEADITDTIERAATETDPAICTEDQTVAFNEQTQFESGDAAVTTCEESIEDTPADSVEVSNVEVDGDSATAEVAFSGGGLDGQTLAVSLVKEDDSWKLDQLDEFIVFDADALAASVGEEAASSGDTPPEVITCVEDAISSGDEAALQEAYLSGDPAQLEGVFGSCFGGQ